MTGFIDVDVTVTVSTRFEHIRARLIEHIEGSGVDPDDERITTLAHAIDNLSVELEAVHFYWRDRRDHNI